MNFDFTSQTLQSYFFTISLVSCILKFSICLFDYVTSGKQTTNRCISKLVLHG